MINIEKSFPQKKSVCASCVSMNSNCKIKLSSSNVPSIYLELADAHPNSFGGITGLSRGITNSSLQENNARFPDRGFYIRTDYFLL